MCPFPRFYWILILSSFTAHSIFFSRSYLCSLAFCMRENPENHISREVFFHAKTHNTNHAFSFLFPYSNLFPSLHLRANFRGPLQKNSHDFVTCALVWIRSGRACWWERGGMGMGMRKERKAERGKGEWRGRGMKGEKGGEREKKKKREMGE